MDTIPEKVKELVAQREQFRNKKNFKESDRIRDLLLKEGYVVTDMSNGPQLEKISEESSQKQPASFRFSIFGSGEMSAMGRRIHESLIKNLIPPVKIALLETAAGFEASPHLWFTKLAAMMEVGLQNFKPEIIRVEALRNDGIYSTNNAEVVAPLLTADYLHAGAGSPTYGVKHLKDSLALEYFKKRIDEGVPTSFASATAMACGEFTLPVYEIYKVGEDLHWKEGLHFFRNWGLNFTVVSHWNNEEGGKEIDTSRCFMGVERFNKLLKLLPVNSTVLGIDELTACIFDLKSRTVKVVGRGTATIIKNGEEKIYKAGSTFSFSNL
jgi:hypothetical protein